jgi:hypothetical protein
MSRASSLAAAADYLSEAVQGLDGAARSLDNAGVVSAADSARALHDRAESLHTEVSLAATVAHRAERPEFYDESGKWVGRQNGKGQH